MRGPRYKATSSRRPYANGVVHISYTAWSAWSQSKKRNLIRVLFTRSSCCNICGFLHPFHDCDKRSWGYVDLLVSDYGHSLPVSDL